MPFPEGWPPRKPSGIRSIRFYVTGTGSANFDDNAFLFSDGVGANSHTPLPVVEPGSSEDVTLEANPMAGGQNDLGAPKPMAFSKFVQITAASAAVEFSFDGINVHGTVPAGERRTMERYEAGISIRGVGATFVVEAW